MKLLIIPLFLYASCKHSPPILEADTIRTSFCTYPAGDSLCNDDWVPPIEATYYGPQMLDGIHYMCPSVNPNNPNQFVCFRINMLFPPKTDIVVYDMHTDEERNLFTYNNAIIGSLTWGKKDWIAYATGQGAISIFKSDGSAAHQIVTSSGMNFMTGMGPEWSYDGNYLYSHTSFGSPSNASLYDTTGKTFSTAPFMLRPDWNRNNKLIGGGDRLSKLPI